MRMGSIVFVPGGPKSQMISIPINNDDEAESNEPLRVNFTSPDLLPDMPIDLPAPEIIIIDDDIGEWSLYRM